MISIPEEVKRLFKRNEYVNYRIKFPFDDIPDITNSQIEDESPSFDESICSQSPIKFGVCEASGFAFTGISLPNIKGKTIDVTCEVDCSALETSEFIESESYDLGMQTMTHSGSSSSTGGKVQTFDITFSKPIYRYRASGSGSNIQGSVTYRRTNVNATVYFKDGTTQTFSGTDTTRTYSKPVLRVAGSISYVCTMEGTSSIDIRYSVVGYTHIPNFVEYKADIDRYIYPVPIGRFIVDSCEREAGKIQRRKVQAYSEDYYNFGEGLPADFVNYLQQQLSSGITVFEDNIQPLFIYLSRTYTNRYVSERLIPAYFQWNKTLELDNGDSIFYGISGHLEKQFVDSVLLTEYDRYPDWENRVTKTVHDYLASYSYETDKEQDVIDDIIQKARAHFDAYPSGRMDYRLNGERRLPLRISITLIAGGQTYPGTTTDIVKKYSDESGDYWGTVYALDDDSINPSYEAFVHDEIKLNIEDMLADGFARDYVEAYVELAGCFGKRPRGPEKLELIQLTTSGGLQPNDGLYPDDGLYPSAAGDGFSLHKNMYSSAWLDETPTLKYSAVVINYKDENDEDKTAITTIVDLTEVDEEGALIHNPAEYQVYDASDNWIAQHGHTSSYESGRDFPIMRVATQHLAQVLSNIQYYPLSADCVGLPYVEAGDVVEVQTDEGYYTSVILQRNLQGILNMTDSFESKE